MIVSVMQLQGVNIGGFFSQVREFTKKHLETFITEQDIRRIKSWGFNCIRLPVDYFFFARADNPSVFIEERLALIDRFLNMAAQYELYTILDLHKAPGHTFQSGQRDLNDIWKQDAQNRKYFLDIWDMLSGRYRNSDRIIYEPLNEPVIPAPEDWNNLAAAAIAVIRKNDPRHPIVVDADFWGLCPGFKELRKFDDNTIIYSFHFYEPILVTHQMAEWIVFYKKDIYRKYLPYPVKLEGLEDVVQKIGKYDAYFTRQLYDYAGEWNRAKMEAHLKPVIEFKEKHNVPILCGEFGFNVKADPVTRQNWLNDLISLLKEHELSYTYWTYKNMDFGIYDFSGRYARNKNYSRQSRLDEQTLQILQQGIK
jgi:endoglucanase